MGVPRYVSVQSLPETIPLCSPQEAAALVRSGDKIAISANANTPRSFLEALFARAEQLEHVEIMHMRLVGAFPKATPELARQISGTGGLVDFVRGAARSSGGRSIIAVPSTALGGKVSRLVPVFEPGTAVSVLRSEVHWVVTEYGARNLRGMTIRERARTLIEIAHPDFREELTDAARARHLLV